MLFHGPACVVVLGMLTVLTSVSLSLFPYAPLPCPQFIIGHGLHDKLAFALHQVHATRRQGQAFTPGVYTRPLHEALSRVTPTTRRSGSSLYPCGMAEVDCCRVHAGSAMDPCP
jgi:hypothetical protein